MSSADLEVSMMRRTLIPIAVAAILALPSVAMARPAAAAAGAVSQPQRVFTARSGTLTASFGYLGAAPRDYGLTLTISQSGTVAYHGSVTSKYCGVGCGPSITPRQGPVQIVDLDHDGTPDVVLNLYSGGADCCFVTQVFVPSVALGGYVMSAQHNFGEAGYRLDDVLGYGVQDFVTANDAFAGAFTDDAASALPLQILQYDPAYGRGDFPDITTAYPSLVRRDAASWLRAYKAQAKSHWSDSVGIIAAWAADEYDLGRSGQALSYLDQQARAGHLNSSLSPQEPDGVQFVAKLRRFLHARGYLS